MAAEDLQDINMKKFLAIMRRPALFVLINFFLINTLLAFAPHGIGDLAYNMLRVCIVAYAGWLVIRKNVGGIWLAALAGTSMYFIDHILLKGGMFLLNYLFKPEGLGLAAFSGVIVSFILFVPLSMGIGALGGLIERSRKVRSSDGTRSATD